MIAVSRLSNSPRAAAVSEVWPALVLSVLVGCMEPLRGWQRSCERGYVASYQSCVEVPVPADTHMIVAGAACRVSGLVIREAMDARPPLRRAMLDYYHRLMVQVMPEAVANASLMLEKRLARSLLQLHDRIDGDELGMTHERLATMLGVRRAGVSVAAKRLEDQGIIRLHRSSIIIADRVGLERICDAGYGAADRQSSGNES